MAEELQQDGTKRAVLQDGGGEDLAKRERALRSRSDWCHSSPRAAEKLRSGLAPRYELWTQQ